MPSERLRPAALLTWTIATFFGSGCLRPGPGTWGSIAAALAISPVLIWLPHHQWLYALLALTVLATVFGLAACPWAIRHYQRGDPSQVVIDEVAGLWLTLSLIYWWAPSLMQAMPFATMVIAFVSFRCFDIAKPWPIYRLERLPGGWGIMIDDLAAGILAAGCSWVVLIAIGQLLS